MISKYSFHFLVIYTDSQGLLHDAIIVENEITKLKSQIGAEIDVSSFLINKINGFPNRDSFRNRFRCDGAFIKIAIFLENFYPCDIIDDASIIKILIPNVEWLSDYSINSSQAINYVLHKTHYSYNILKSLFLHASHEYIGFTSIDPCVVASKSHTFAHFTGKSKNRHTQEILSLWSRRNDYPPIFVQLYLESKDDSERSINFPHWLVCNNVNLLVNRVGYQEYFQQLKQHCFHLCLSSTEGFGHYINEARAMSAFVCTINAAPMNELIDNDCGMLIEPTNKHESGLVNYSSVTPEQIEYSIDKLLTLPKREIHLKTINARERFLFDKKNFSHSFNQFIEKLLIRYV